jgi:hypothetical protein
MPREPPVISAIFPFSFLDIIFLLFLKLAHLEIQPRMWAMPARLVDFAQHFRLRRAVFGVEDPRIGGRNRNVAIFIL